MGFLIFIVAHTVQVILSILLGPLLFIIISSTFFFTDSLSCLHKMLTLLLFNDTKTEMNLADTFREILHRPLVMYAEGNCICSFYLQQTGDFKKGFKATDKVIYLYAECSVSKVLYHKNEIHFSVLFHNIGKKLICSKVIFGHMPDTTVCGVGATDKVGFILDDFGLQLVKTRNSVYQKI